MAQSNDAPMMAPAATRMLFRGGVPIPKGPAPAVDPNSRAAGGMGKGVSQSVRGDSRSIRKPRQDNVGQKSTRRTGRA